jgi:hypothetical protein
MHDDLLIGAASIARFLLGADDRAAVMKMYRLSEKLPVFKLGRQMAARRSTLAAAIERLEREKQGNAA